MMRADARRPDAGPSTSSAQPDVQQLYATIAECLQMEAKFQPRLCLGEDDEKGEVSRGARDGAAHVLRCLKMFFDLPTDVLLHAINLFDRFLTKMKVRPCHVPCITVSCMNLAIEHYALQNKEQRKVSIEELVSISQATCTARDVWRMSRVVDDKLALAGGAPLTALHALRALTALLTAAAAPLPLPRALIECEESSLTPLLEIMACDYDCANARASEVALVLLYHKIESNFVEWSRAAENGGEPIPEQAYTIFEFLAELQALCNVSANALRAGRGVAARYGRGAARAQRQRLVWRLSERTLKVLRPTDRLTSLLPTIEEQHLGVEASPTRNRSGSESSENEETSDWPRSPVLPVYCNN